MIVGNEYVRYMDQDEAAKSFLDLAIPCGNMSATMKDFLEMRGAEEKGGGIRDTFTLSSQNESNNIAVVVHEHTTKMNGDAIPYAPEDITYSYLIELNTARFISS